MAVLRYDPGRIRDLDRRAAAAAADLAELTSGDPEAAGAMSAVRLAHDHLEHDWLPLLRRIARSDAMLTWLAGGPTALDRDDLTDLAALLDSVADDPDAVDAFFGELGGAGTAELLLMLGAHADDPDGARAVATTIRDRLAEASRRPGLQADFVEDLVDCFVESLARPDANAGVALSFLLGSRLDTDFLVATTHAIVEHELTAAGDEPEYGGSLWAPSSSIGAPPSILIDAFDRQEADSPDLRPGGDPMMAVLDALAADGVAGRRVFTDEPVARYLLGERDYWMDGMRRLAEAAAVAASGAGRGHALVASAFVNHVGSRGSERVLGMYDIDPVREAAATILGDHMTSVHDAFLTPTTVDPPTGLLAANEHETRGGGPGVMGAVLDETCLEIITRLAVGSPNGLVTLRAGVDAHQQSQAAVGVARIAGGDRDERWITEAARLEAHVIEQVGHRAELMGRSRDDDIKSWIGAASSVVDELDVRGLDLIIDTAADAMTEQFAVNEAAAVDAATAQAEVAIDRLLHTWHRELYEQGVVVPNLPAGAVVDGQLVAWEDFQHLDDDDRKTVRSRMEAGAAEVEIDSLAARDAMKLEQRELYDELP